MYVWLAAAVMGMHEGSSFFVLLLMDISLVNRTCCLQRVLL